MGLSLIAGCPECDDYAKKMDAWGAAGCKLRKQSILDRLQLSANHLGIPFPEDFAKWLITEAIRRAEAETLPKP